MSSLLSCRWRTPSCASASTPAAPKKSSPLSSNSTRCGTAVKQENRTSANNIQGRKEIPWAINITDVKNDMIAGQGRPQWILSTYGPGRGPPASLLENNEYSFEELRLRYYELARAGNEAQANQEAGALWTKAEDGMRTIAENADDVIKYMEDADKKHPNRYDFCQTDGTKTREELAKAAESKNSFGGGFGQPATSSGFGQSGFGQPSQPVQSANPFAQPSAANAFGKPTFGQPAAGAGFGQTGFGQPSQPAQSANPFAKPSVANAFGKPAFGQPAAGAGFGQSGFGQPSQPAIGSFGQPSQPASGFGQPSQPVQSANPFAQPVTGFGQRSQPASAFGQPSQLNTAAFGQPAAPGGFGHTGFGQPSQAATSGLDLPSQPAASGFGQLSQPAGGFGQPSQPATSSFGAPSQPAASGFGQLSPQPATSGFGQLSLQPAASGFDTGTSVGPNPRSASPFGQSVAPTATGGFGQPSNQPAATGFGRPSSQPASGGFDTAPSAPQGFTTTANAQGALTSHPLTGQPPAPLHYTETIPKRAASFRPGSRDVSSYAGRRVQYVNDAPCYDRPDGKGLERLWFPEGGNGADVLALNTPEKKVDLEGKAEDYTDSVKQAYVHLFTKGRFEDAGMPTVPPLREWCAFDF
jgi:nucleoporin NUP42